MIGVWNDQGVCGENTTYDMGIYDIPAHKAQPYYGLGLGARAGQPHKTMHYSD